MEWVKLAAVPAYYIDGALLRAGEAAEVLFCRGLAHCGGVESAGRIDKTVLPLLVQRKAKERADALVREGLWLDEGTHYRVRSWDKWQDQHDVAAEKRRKDRERQREHRRKASQQESRDPSQAASRDSHSDIRDGHDVDVEGERERDKKRTTSSSSDAAPQPSKAKRATRIPDDFPAEADVERLWAWALEHCPAVPIKIETDQWLDYHRAKGDLAKDWVASWRTWMRNAQKYSERTGRTPGQLALVRPDNRPSTTDTRVAETRARAAALRAGQDTA